MRNDTKQAYNTSARSRKAAAGAGAADRAAAVGGVALDAARQRHLAEAAVHGDRAAAARQHQGSQHVERLR